MPTTAPTNVEVALIFLRVGELMSYKDESTFKIRAYYRAALTLTALTTPLQAVVDKGQLHTLPGVGEAIAGKIGEILQTGTCALYERLKSETSPSIQQMLCVPSLTPRLVRLLETEFNLDSMEALLTFVAQGDLSDLEGTAIKVEDAAQILRAAEGLGAFAQEG